MFQNKRHLIWGTLIVVILLRLLLTQQMGLMPQDAYYFFYGQHLALSYFDHPPMIAYVLRVFAELFGQSVAVIKLTDFVVTLGSIALFYQLATKFLARSTTTNTAIFYASTLLVSVLSLNSTPDVPLIFFWTLALLLLYKALFEQRTLYWPLAGLTIGFAFSSKYTALFLLAGLFLFLLSSYTYRGKLWSKDIVLLLVGTLVGMAPVLLWNYQNDWVSLLFQSSDRADQIMELKLRPLDFLGNIGTQMLLLLPPLFFGLYYAFFREAKAIWIHRVLPDDRTLFLLAFSLPIIGFFTGVSFFYWVKLNWMMPAYVTGIVLAGRYLQSSQLVYQLGFAVVFHILAYVQIVYYPVLIKSDDTWMGWDALAEQVEQLQASYPEHFVFANDDYKTSAALDFYLKDKVFAGNVIGYHGKQFAFVYPNLDFLRGQNAFYIDSDKRMRDTLMNPQMPGALPNYFNSIEQLPPILIRDESGRLVRKFWVYECRDYHSSIQHQ